MTSEKPIIGLFVQLSVAVAMPVLAGNVLAVHSMVTLIGQVIAGAWLSSTKITWLQVLELPQSSVACQVRVMVISAGHIPGKEISLNVTVTEASQLSVAVAIPVAAGNVLVLHNIVMFAGHVMTGAVLSSIKIV